MLTKEAILEKYPDLLVRKDVDTPLRLCDEAMARHQENPKQISPVFEALWQLMQYANALEYNSVLDKLQACGE